jgi:hypothetical protein
VHAKGLGTPKIVFISYAAEDEAVVMPIVTRLRNHRFNVWTMLDNPPSTHYPTRIQTLIPECGVFVLMASDNARTSRDVEAEVRIAVDNRKPIVPVLLQNGADRHFSYSIQGLVHVKLLLGAEDPAFPRLVDGIEASSPGRWPEQVTRRATHNDNLAPLRPYLVNRADQEGIITRYLKDAVAVRTRRPSVFLLHGREDECGDMFIRRIAHYTIPRLLPETVRPVELPNPISWPGHWDDDVADPLEEARSRKAALLDSTEERIAQASALQPSAIVLNLQLPIDEWSRSDQALLESFLSWWSDYPDLPKGQALVVMVYVSHGLGAIGPWLRRWRVRRIGGLFRTTSARAPARAVAPLPVLRGVSQIHAAEWVQAHHELLRSAERELVMKALIPCFRHPLGVGTRRVPMERAATVLKTLLRSDESAASA